MNSNSQHTEHKVPIIPMTINGHAVVSENFQEIFNPSTGKLVGMAPLGTLANLEAAIMAANTAKADYAKSADETLKGYCRAAAEAIAENSAELARLLTLEQGKPLKGLGAEFELSGCVGWMATAADYDLPVKILQDDETKRVEQHREPIGVIGSITPWNWPLMIAVWHIAPALRSGNCVVIKPSPQTPLSTLRMIEIIAGIFPKGVVNIVTDGPDIGPAMTAHAGIDKIIFTGSTQTGKHVMQNSAGTLKRLTLELGGNDAGIVLPDAHPSHIAEGLFWGAFINNGQTCAAMKRLYVHDDIYEAVCEQLVALANQIPMGDGLDENNVLGPIQNKQQFDKVAALVEDAGRKGARILTGGAPIEGPGYFYPVTLVADATAGMRIVDEEQFGPTLPIIRYTDLDDAIAQANGLDFGLAASVWSSDPIKAGAVARQLEAGTVYTNKHGEIAPHIPFGGIKSSGVGVEFGIEGLEACTNIKIYNVAK
jgi:acyl-CoA reductase-like NAD-dependent aldehyde dehydrogenase